MTHTGAAGRPAKRLRKGVRVRLKNKGSRKSTERKRPKYEAPVAEHPETDSRIEVEQINANPVEAFNSSLRRRKAEFRRKTIYVCKNSRAPPKDSRCAMVSAQLYQSSFHDESCSGCQIRDLIGWVIVEQFILDSLRLLVQIQWGFQLLLPNGTSAENITFSRQLVGHLA